jgi:serine/threonine protein kinase
MTARITVKPAALARNTARTIEITQFVVRRCEDAVRMEVSPSRTSSKQVPSPTNAQADSKTCHGCELNLPATRWQKTRAIPANSDSEDIDTRTDVYSLGAVLYELLSGALPFDLRKAAYDEVLRRLREEDAPKPKHADQSCGGRLSRRGEKQRRRSTGGGAPVAGRT